MARPAILPGCLLLVLLSLSHMALGRQHSGQSKDMLRQREDAQQCRLQNVSPSRPYKQIQSEAGRTDLWNEDEDQFQCAGVAPVRNIIKPNGLSLPNASPAPRLVYIEQGRGVLGIITPGCPETYHSRGQAGAEGQEGSERRGDEHQQIFRIEAGDVVALQAGFAHWCFNDGDKDLIAVSVTDINSESNQLDNTLRSFYLAGGQYGKGEEREDADNIIRPLDENMLAKALDVPVELVRKVQADDKRGFTVECEEGSMSMVKPDEEQGRRQNEEATMVGNGLGELYCNVRPRFNLDTQREADVFVRRAGRLNTVNMNKLPILQLLGMSAEKARLEPNALFAPHWEMNSHSIMYMTKGEARVQVAGPNGQTVCDATVKEGDMLVIPQYFVVMKKAGDRGCEWVSFKTSPLPMKNPLVGKASSFNGMPASVLRNAYEKLTYEEARQLKRNRQQFLMFLPPTRTGSS
ncbi:hypothetical protein ACLOJK_011487 [Asimina triloba]